MANTANGALESIVLNGLRFTCDAEDEPEITLPGFNNEVKPNSDGTVRVTKTRHAGKIEGLKIQIDLARGDLEAVQEMKDSKELVSMSGTMTNGSVVSGEVQITSDGVYNAGDGTMEITLEGNLRLL